MDGFWIAAGLMITTALLFVVPPLLRTPPGSPPARKQRTGQSPALALLVDIHRDALRELDADLKTGKLTPETYEESRNELMRRVLDETAAVPVIEPSGRRRRLWTAAIVAVAMPLCAASIYLKVSPSRADSAGAAAQSSSERGPMSAQQLAQHVEQLTEHLRRNSDDAQSWHQLARAHQRLRQLPAAAAAYARAAALMPGDPDVLVDYADTLAAVSGKNLNGQPMELVQAALRINPNHQKGLAVAGTAAFNFGDFALAIRYFERLLRTFPPDSQNARSVAVSIDKARAAMAASTAPTEPPRSSRAPGAGSAPSIDGTVAVDRGLAARVASTDTVFIAARAVNGPNTPLAVLRMQAKDLPMSFRLDDSMAMSPSLKLSNYQSVVVLARISKSGNATPASGDLVGSVGPVIPGGRDVKVLIDRVVP